MSVLVGLKPLFTCSVSICRDRGVEVSRDFSVVVKLERKPLNGAQTHEQVILETGIGVRCEQFISLEQSLEYPSPCAVRELLGPMRGIPHFGGRPAAAGVRSGRLEVQAHRAAVHRRAGRPGGHFRQRGAIMGFLEPGPGPARLQAGPLPSIEGDRCGAGAVEVRRCGLVAGRTRLDHGEAYLSATCREIPGYWRPRRDDGADSSPRGQKRQ